MQKRINTKCFYKKGFTLIELLAVIIILAVIALIATPGVLNVVDNANKKANKASAYGLLDAAKLYYSESLLDDTRVLDGTTNLINNIKISGQKPDSGSIYINNLGEIKIFAKYGDVCYKKNFSDSDLTETNDTNCGLTVPEESCFTYESNDTGITITSYTCGATTSDLSDGKYLDIIIPSEINGQTVTKIGYSAFSPRFKSSTTYISSVVIPEGVTTIGESAFESNQLTSVTIPESVTYIGDSSFTNNKLTSITIPSSAYIDWYAFSHNQLTSVVIPDGVKSIGMNAFEANQLTSITIPSSVTTIDKAAFNNNLLPDDQAFIYKRNSDGSIDYTTIVSYGGTKRDNVVIPEGVTTIDEESFAYNQLTSITIPEGVTYIETNAFRNNQLTSISIPNSVTYIGFWTFSYNPDMTITIDNTSDSISGSPWGASSTSTITYLR
jgi:prepilin-type N-terminal cleavage/methylation domain-containing protein